MKCKVAARVGLSSGLLSLSMLEWVKKQAEGAVRQKRALGLKRGKNDREANERAKSPFSILTIIIGHCFWYLYASM